MEGTVVGRDAMLEDAWGSLTAPGWLLLEGPAGIGKTAMLRALVARARAAGMIVIGCAPTEAETALPLAALADLLHPLADLLADLPAPQRAAVTAVLLTGDVDDPNGLVDERALAVATRTLVEAAASRAEAGVLLAVDDAPWLDPPSERALRYVLRRLSERVAVLVTRRTTDDADAAPLELDRAPRLTRVTLRPLGVGPLHHLLKRQFGVPLSRPMVSRLAHDSGGNPLLAIELTRAVLRLPTLPAPGADLPVPASMQGLVAASLATLPAESLTAVRLAAMLSTPSLADLAAAGVQPQDLDAVEEAGLVTVSADDRVRFVHPVHAAAVRAEIPPGVRRRLHERLAEVGSDADERARHLARSTIAPDPGVAVLLAAAAGRARSRGAPEVAADFFDRAAELTPDAPEQAHLRLCAAHCRYDSGDYVVAGAQAERIAADLSGDRQAEALLLRAAIAFSVDDPSTALAAATRALAAATAGSGLAGRIHAHLAVYVDLPGPAREHAEAAMRLLPDSGPASDSAQIGRIFAQDDQPLLASVLMLLFLNEVRSGAPARPDLLTRALELEDGEPSWLAGTVPAIWWKGTDQHALARARLEWMLQLATASGEEPLQHELIAHLGETETLAGRFEAAAGWITRSRELAEQLAAGTAAEMWLAGMLDVHRGATDAAAQAAEHGLREAERTGEPWARRINLQLAGFAALADGRAADAARHYGELADAVDATGLAEPLSTRFEGDWVEACVGAGDLATAELAAARLELRHQRLPRPWTALAVGRSRVLIAGARGLDTLPLIEALLAERAAIDVDIVPFERARCLVVAGLAHRRARRKLPARSALLAAAAEFDELGAPGFADRARAEATRTGGRPAASNALTSTEEQVARLAASGRTNRAIAEALFISPKTVEANLARVYRKLGIGSRAELGAAMAGPGAGVTQGRADEQT